MVSEIIIFLTIVEKNIIEMKNLQVIPKLIGFLKSNHENIVRESALTIKNLAVNDENSAFIGKLKGVEHLLHIINTSKSDQLRKVAALTIQSLAKNTDNMKIIEQLKNRNDAAQRNPNDR